MCEMFSVPLNRSTLAIYFGLQTGCVRVHRLLPSRALHRHRNSSCPCTGTGGMPWNVNLGPLAISDKGVDVRPKMDIGVAYGNFYCNAGVGDVRDSLSFGLDANVNQQFHASGIGLKQFLANLKAQDGIADDYINPLMQQSNKIVAEVLRLIDMDIRGAHIDGVMKMETGFGFHGSASLGWRDTEGYHMVGAGGKVRRFPPPARIMRRSQALSPRAPRTDCHGAAPQHLSIRWGKEQSGDQGHHRRCELWDQDEDPLGVRHARRRWQIRPPRRGE